jgi:regulatory protein
MDAIDKLTAKTLKLLSYRPRSVYEIRFRLKKISPSPKLINQVINRFLEEDLLNDQKFARWWVDQRINHRPRGNFALKAELFQKGIDKEIIDQVLLTPAQEKKLAKKIISSRQTQLKSLSLRRQKIKASQWLKTRGFTSSAIYAVIDELIT